MDSNIGVEAGSPADYWKQGREQAIHDCIAEVNFRLMANEYRWAREKALMGLRALLESK